MKKPVCSNCATNKHIVEKETTTEFEVKGEKLKHTYLTHYCESCDEPVAAPGQTGELLRTVYDIYKTRHGLLTSGQIKDIRKSYRLSLRDFSKILGISYVTYFRYEKGVVQDRAHNNLLLLVGENPKNGLALFEKVKDRFQPHVCNKIHNILVGKVQKFEEATWADAIIKS